jgi:hypothetical protein
MADVPPSCPTSPGELGPKAYSLDRALHKPAHLSPNECCRSGRKLSRGPPIRWHPFAMLSPESAAKSGRATKQSACRGRPETASWPSKRRFGRTEDVELIAAMADHGSHRTRCRLDLLVQTQQE